MPVFPATSWWQEASITGFKARYIVQCRAGICALRGRHLMAPGGSTYHCVAATAFITSISRSCSTKNSFSLVFSYSKCRKFLALSALMSLKFAATYIVCSLMPSHLATKVLHRGLPRAGSRPSALLAPFPPPLPSLSLRESPS
jgi:hypothetical protein